MPPQNLDDILKMTGTPAGDSGAAAPALSPMPDSSGGPAPSSSLQPTVPLRPEHVATLDNILQQTGQAEQVSPDVQKNIDQKTGLIDQFKQEVAGPGTVLGDAMASASDVGHGVKRMLEGDVVGGAKQAVGNIHGKTLASSTLTRGSEQIDAQKHPILKAGLEFAEGMTSPVNLALIAGSGGLGMIDSAAKIYTVHQLANLGFTSQQIVDMYNRFPEVKKAWDKGDASKVLYEGTHILLSGVLSLAGGMDMAGKPIPAVGEPERAAAQKVGEVATAVKEAPGKVTAKVKGALAAPEVEVESNPIEDIKSAFLSKLKPSDADKVAQVGYNALAAEHKLNTIHDPEEAAAAVQKQITEAEGKVMEGAIKQIPDEPIIKEGKPVSVWDEVKNELESRKSPTVGFVDDAMKALERYGLTEGKTVSVSDADRIRRTLNDETTSIEKKPENQQVRIENIDPKYAALQVAKDVLRDGVYDTIDEHGLDKGVTARDFRRDIIGNLIAFRDSLLDSIKRPDQQVRGTAPEAPKESLARKVARGATQGAIPAVAAGAGYATGHPALGAAAAGGSVPVSIAAGEKLFPKPEVPEDLTRSELLDRALNHPEADKFVTETPEEQQIRGNIQKPAAPKPRGQQEVPFGPPEIFGMNQGEASPLEMRSEQLDKITAYIQKLRDVMNDPAATSVEKDAAQHQVEKMFGGNIPEGFKRPKEQGAVNLAAPRLLEAKEFDEPGRIKNRMGLDTKAILNHELAHAVLAHVVGLEPLDVISNKHTDARPNVVAATRVAWPEDLMKRSDGTLEPKALRERLTDILAVYMAGGVANELYDDVKVENNKSLAGDINEINETLSLLGLSAEEKTRFREWGEARAKAILQDSDVENLVNEFSDTREKGLPESHHYSAVRMLEFRDRLNKLRGKNAINVEGTHGNSPEQFATSKPGGEKATETVRAEEAARATGAGKQVGEKQAKIEGSNLQQPEWLFQQYEREIQRAKDLMRNPDAKPEEKEYAQQVLESSKALQSLLPVTDVAVPPERSAGVHDEAIKQAGAVPGGIQTGDPEIEVPDLVLFHDPQTGSTLALPSDKVTPENVSKQMQKSRDQFAAAKQKKVDQFASKVKIGYGKPEEAHEAITNTPGAKWDGDKLTVEVSRRQKPEQAGDISPRTGVFFLPEKSSRFARHYTGRGWYGGTQKVEGQLTFENPMIVKGATGGAAPAKAYDSIKGKGAYDQMRKDVLASIHPVLGKSENIEGVSSVLQKYSGDPDLAEKIVEVSKQGNTLPFAVQEHIVAHALREAGHDAIVGYTNTKQGKRLSEVFDLTRKTFPTGGVLALLGLVSGAAAAVEQQEEKKK